MKIYLIEDNLGDSELIRYALKHSGINHELKIFASGDDALPDIFSLSTEDLPNLILLDLNLPGMSGHEVLEELKKNEVTRPIPVLILSSSHAPNDISEAYRSHASSYIVKPFEISEYINIAKSITQYWVNTAVLPN